MQIDNNNKKLSFYANDIYINSDIRNVSFITITATFSCTIFDHTVFLFRMYK